jgi:hypothetical protein
MPVGGVATILGGKIVDTRLRGLAAPLPPINVDWSSVKTYGGFYAKPSGVRRAFGMVDAAAESEEQRN